MKSAILVAFCFIGLQSLTQIPPANRLVNWSLAGPQSTIPLYRQVVFSGSANGVIDNSAALKAIIDTITAPTYILFGGGNYLFSQTITINKGIILKGLGNTQTTFTFNQGGADTPSIQISGTEITTNYTLTENAVKGQQSLLVSTAAAANFKAGDFCRILQVDTEFINDSWASQRTGQVLRIDSVKAGRIYFASPLRMDYQLSRNPRIRKMNPVKFAGVECLKIIRQDYSNTGSGSANIDMRYAADCRIAGVESRLCNFGHVEIFYSTNILIEDCYFQDAHNFGGDGRGYGVMLQFATGEVLVQNNIFRRLRHAMILQAGANGNVFAYNYAFESRKEIFPGIFTTGEDLVCHGNYPYANLFESNYCQFPLVDNSHGKNGPFNTFFRNYCTTRGPGVNSTVSDSQNISANHHISSIGTIFSSNHYIKDNSWQGASTLSDSTLVYGTTPAFLSGYGMGKIGPPLFNPSVSIPARDRALAAQHINKDCGIIVWTGTQWVNGFAPSIHTSAYTLKVMPGNNAVISSNTVLRSVEILPGSNLQVQPGVQLTLDQ